MKTSKQECGCRHDGRQWLQMCDAHEQEHAEMHIRARIDYRAAMKEREEEFSWLDG